MVFNISSEKYFRNWMNLRDASSGKILWQSDQDLSEPGKEHEGMKTSILNIRTCIAIKCDIQLSAIKCNFWRSIFGEYNMSGIPLIETFGVQKNHFFQF